MKKNFETPLKMKKNKSFVFENETEKKIIDY